MWLEEYRRIILDRRRDVISSPVPSSRPEIAVSAAEQAWHRSHAHRHHRREIMVDLAGETIFMLGEKHYRVGPGAVLLIDRRECHDNGYFPGSGDAVHLRFFVHRDFIICRGDEFRGGKLEFAFRRLCRDASFTESFNRQWDVAAQSGAHSDSTVFGLMARLDLLLLDLLAESAPDVASESTPPQAAVEKAKQYLEDCCGRQCGIDFLAELTGYSAVHFQRLFRRFTGMTVGQYVDGVRCRRFEEMRLSCQHKVIAEELGFGSPAAFSNWVARMRRRGAL